MRSTRIAVLVVLAASVLGGWFVLARANVQAGHEYDAYLTAARAKAELGVTSEVVENYRAALDLRPDDAVAAELADYVVREEEDDAATDILEDLVNAYPTTAVFYERLAAEYVADEQYPDAFAVYHRADRKHVRSPVLTAGYRSIEYAYELGTTRYIKVTPFSADDVAGVGDGAGVLGGGVSRWLFVDAQGRKIGDPYDEVGAFAGGNGAVVRDSLPFYVDDRGRTTYVARLVDYTRYGTLASGIIPAEKPDGTTTYLSTDFTPKFDGTSFDEGYAFVGGLAAVRSGSQWKVIGTDGIQVGGPYERVAVDEAGAAVGAERYFASTSGSYRMYDADGTQVTTTGFADARPFEGTGPAAVKIGDRWGFVDAEGEVVIKPAYDDARSFANGLAAVEVDGAWGYVDAHGTLVIPARFEGATDFSSRGSTFVATQPPAADDSSTAASWQLLTLYRFEE